MFSEKAHRASALQSEFNTVLASARGNRIGDFVRKWDRPEGKSHSISFQLPKLRETKAGKVRVLEKRKTPMHDSGADEGQGRSAARSRRLFLVAVEEPKQKEIATGYAAVEDRSLDEVITNAASEVTNGFRRLGFGKGLNRIDDKTLDDIFGDAIGIVHRALEGLNLREEDTISYESHLYPLVGAQHLMRMGVGDAVQGCIEESLKEDGIAAAYAVPLGIGSTKLLEKYQFRNQTDFVPFHIKRL